MSLHIGATESSKYWLTVMNELKTSGVQTVLIFCTDNLRDLDDATKSYYPDADHQKCILHQIRNSVKHVSYKRLKGGLCRFKDDLYSSNDRSRNASI
ncbi:MAG: transposase [Holosporaceae bacterium]|nr:transposase [Holosporaceae bacterium]